MMKITAASLIAGVAAQCDGSACQNMRMSTPSRLAEMVDEFPDPELNVNTFTAVDKCATQEVTDLTGWVLQYYETVSNDLDSSFSNILTIARMANSALFQLSHLSAEMAAYQRINEIATQMNSMLRTCLADAMHLSASLERCDGMFSQTALDMNMGNVAPSGSGSGLDSVWVKPRDFDVNGTCLAAVCEHVTAWNHTCGKGGFLSDLERIAAAHDLEGQPMAFSAARATPFHAPITNLYADENNAATFAIWNEDLFTQEFALLHRVSGWIEVQMQGMMVMIRRSLNGGQFAQKADLDLCSALGFPMEQVEWLSLAFEKCEGSMVKTWLKVNPLNRDYMHKLVKALADKIPNVYKSGNPGVLYGGMLTNLCTKFDNLQPDIQAALEELQADHTSMTGGQGDATKIDTFYLSGVSPIEDKGNKMVPFDDNTGKTQSYGIADKFLNSPF